MPADSRSKNGVASVAYVAGIHDLIASWKKDVDGRNKSGHDGKGDNRNQLPHPPRASSTACNEMRDQAEILSRKAT